MSLDDSRSTNEEADDSQITVATAAKFDRVQSQIKSLKLELDSISKKKPDGPLNKFKVKLINELFEAVNPILGEQYRPFKEFLLFEDSDLPSASDAVVMLSQYLTAMGRFMVAHSWRPDRYSPLVWHYSDKADMDENWEEDEDEDEADAESENY